MLRNGISVRQKRVSEKLECVVTVNRSVAIHVAVLIDRISVGQKRVSEKLKSIVAVDHKVAVNVAARILNNCNITGYFVYLYLLLCFTLVLYLNYR